MAKKKAKTGNKAVGFILLLLISGIIFWQRNNIISKFRKAPVNENDQRSLPSGGDSTYKECKGFPIKQGCKGKAVSLIQRALNLKHKSGLDVDSIFGPKTQAALEENGYVSVITNKDQLREVITA
ncbi:MAG: hypothetical protein C0594_01285 [Marinilabiliales bacterium]|nr:MAG: hypothetical protein C0594_01285 [Marinilabiliales bacterium]